jgi:2-keto-4-pentenoate hydratase/2-oxohepta-3-ene-1,7-dioic acid hydratase in catechol pathway
MKIAQYHHEDGIRPGLMKDGLIQAVDFEGDALDLIRSRAEIRAGQGRPVPLEKARLAPPVTAPSKIIAIGLNYRDHADESKGEIPEFPLVFAKFPNSLIAHGEQIKWDRRITGKVDFEAELAVIVGETVRHCSESEAMDAVFGYTCANDVSARDLQFGDGQWVRGKSLDTFCPLGPWVVTRDEIPDPHALNIRCRLNDRLMQDSNTGLMIFRVPALISFLSRHFTLFPGDIILTGTPSGVGAFRDPSVYMKDGDRVEVEIEGIGTLENKCRAL